MNDHQSVKKAIVSFASGKLFTEMLGIALPRFYKYATTFDYDLIIPSYQSIQQYCMAYGWDIARPISWLKIPAIKYLLEHEYDIIQWIDCDVIINRFDKDITQDFVNSDTHNQALVPHYDKYEGIVPNCGIWSLKKSAIPLLDTIWNSKEFINHKWWEQGANIELMKHPNVFNSCLMLSYEFNVHKNDVRFLQQDWEKLGVMLHATTYENRKEKMKEWNNHELD